MRFKKIFVLFLCFIILTIHIPETADASDSFSFVLLTNYSMSLNIREEAYLIAITSNGKSPSFSSSDTKIASVNTYGKIIAKKAGVALITAKIRNAEASCLVTVNKTRVSINKIKLSLERGETSTLTASASNNSEIIWKSSKKSVATVDEKGLITALKPGETTITATADQTSVTCLVTVRNPIVTLSKTNANLYRNQTLQLSAAVSSGIPPQWKTNKKSIATVDKSGKVTAIKHGTAIITATVDGVSKTCEIIVDQPQITMTPLSLNLKTGETYSIKATVSSNNTPIWSTSNPSVATVDKNGKVKTLQKGRAYIYATEDGIKVKATVYVTE
ncbi:MAG: hypothetical protein K0S61_434 [Anaerocolumna sp.]|nr:hypothetical protein [Anaerocolumna sp.]